MVLGHVDKSQIIPGSLKGFTLYYYIAVVLQPTSGMAPYQKAKN